MDDASLRADMIEGLEHELGSAVEPPVLTALQRVSREPFVADSSTSADAADDGHSLSLAAVVRLLMALDADDGDEVLVVGAGVGYSVALLAEIAGARRVHAVDIDRTAVAAARSNLDTAGYGAVLVDRADGANGLPAYAPYDRILVEAAVVEPPRALRNQLAPGGRIAYPRGTGVQTIAAVERATADSGADGWTDREADGRVDREADSRADAPEVTPEPTDSDDDAPVGFKTVDTFGPVRLRPMLVDGEQRGVERNRTRREDAEHAAQGGRHNGWEQGWIDWDDQL